MHDPALRSQLGGISTPVHIVWGAADRVVNPRYGARYAEGIPGAALTILDTAGHLPQLEAPELTRDLVWTFTDQHARHRPPLRSAPTPQTAPTRPHGSFGAACRWPRKLTIDRARRGPPPSKCPRPSL